MELYSFFLHTTPKELTEIFNKNNLFEDINDIFNSNKGSLTQLLCKKLKLKKDNVIKSIELNKEKKSYYNDWYGLKVTYQTNSITANTLSIHISYIIYYKQKKVEYDNNAFELGSNVICYDSNVGNLHLSYGSICDECVCDENKLIYLYNKETSLIDVLNRIRNYIDFAKPVYEKYKAYFESDELINDWKLFSKIKPTIRIPSNFSRQIFLIPDTDRWVNIYKYFLKVHQYELSYIEMLAIRKYCITAPIVIQTSDEEGKKHAEIGGYLESLFYNDEEYRNRTIQDFDLLNFVIHLPEKVKIDQYKTKLWENAFKNANIEYKELCENGLKTICEKYGINEKYITYKNDRSRLFTANCYNPETFDWIVDVPTEFNPNKN